MTAPGAHAGSGAARLGGPPRGGGEGERIVDDADGRAVACGPARPWLGRAGALLVAVVLVAPALAPGYVLLRDMVVVPRQYLGPGALGLGAAPRAVPVDAVMAVLTAVVPGQLVQKVALVGIGYAAVLGAARLVPAGPDGRRGVAAAVAGLGYGWTPYVAERLLMGHWSLLCGYAALPWVVAAALRLRDGDRGALAALVLAMAPTALTPTGALLGGGAAVAVAGRGRRAPTLAVTAGYCLPWLVAGLLDPAAALTDPAGVAAFTARAEGWAGTAASVLGTGGIWNAAAVPVSRTLALSPLVTAALLGLAVAGARSWPAAWRGLLVPAAAGLVLAVAAALPGLGALLGWAVATVPGAGLLRDGQKWLAWWALVLALGAGLGARTALAGLRRRGAGRRLCATAAFGALLLPLCTVPDLAWGVGGRLRPVAYPGDWDRVAAVLAAEPDRGEVLLAPFAAQRSFAWNDGRVGLDPAPRYLPAPTVGERGLAVGGTVIDHSDHRSALVVAAADDPAALAAAGVGWVLVEHGTPGPPPPGWVDAQTPAFDGRWLTLVRVPGRVVPVRTDPRRLAAVAAAHLVPVIGFAGALGWRLRSALDIAPRRRARRR